MDENLPRVTVDDLVAATASGVLRALEARQRGAEQISAVDFVRSGFTVDIYLRAGFLPLPEILNRSGRGPGTPQLPASDVASE
jgi:hypothetical protein